MKEWGSFELEPPAPDSLTYRCVFRRHDLFKRLCIEVDHGLPVHASVR